MSITANECRLLIDEALIKFGRYNYFDKGARETINLDEVVSKFKRMPVAEVADVLAEVTVIMQDEGHEFVHAMLQHVDGDSYFDPLYQDKRIVIFY